MKPIISKGHSTGPFCFFQFLVNPKANIGPMTNMDPVSIFDAKLYSLINFSSLDNIFGVGEPTIGSPEVANLAVKLKILTAG